jgi:hypothetical protein
MVTSQLCFRKVCPLSLLLVFVVLPTTVFSLEAGMTTLGQRILANPTLKPKGYHDSTPPALVVAGPIPALTIEGPDVQRPLVLNVLAQVQTVTMTLLVSDDFSGCKTVEIMTSGRDGSDTTAIMRTSANSAGTRRMGTWVLKKAIPSLSANGTWAVSFIRLTDLQGNQKVYYENELIGMGINTKYEVISALCMTSPWLCPEYKQLQDLVNKDDERDLRQKWIYYYYRQIWYATNQTFIPFEKSAEADAADAAAAVAKAAADAAASVTYRL